MLFQQLERVVIECDRRALASKVIRGDEEYLRSHYPGYPIVPGIVVLDAIAQSGAFLVHIVTSKRVGKQMLPILAMIESVKFLQAVKPGQRLHVKTEIADTGTGAVGVDGAAEVDGAVVVTARLIYTIVEMAETVMGLEARDLKALRDYWNGMCADVRRAEDSRAINNRIT
ncbi:MAG TPA: hypothetical protein VGX03_11690 [Candidatus Binatia bacterium]|jgi:3-hydroxyacyl-[acyl-carrier-protein] dehydratase|nr:hypothetical protein [Candidatus Binatia bacterium]